MDDAKQAQWWSIEELPDLAFDHDLIMKELIEERM